jgi:hypothetical protein
MVVVATLVSLAASLHADTPIHRIHGADGTLVADTPALTTEIRKRMAADFTPPQNEIVSDYSCGVGVMTNLVVSWWCAGRTDHNGAAQVSAGGAWLIDGGKLVPITYDMVFKHTAADDAALEKVSGTRSSSPCPFRAHTDVVLYDDHLELFNPGDGSHHGCAVDYADVQAQLQPTFARLAAWLAAQQEAATAGGEVDTGPAAVKTSPKRFVADGKDSVRDTETGLVWAAHDSGADLDADAALAFAKAYRGDGHADWRLPTADELATLATPDLAHKEPKDCTGGKSRYVITPLIHLSCGLAWSSTAAQGGVTGFGFISGTPRVSKRAEKKNYRALVVRKG